MGCAPFDEIVEIRIGRGRGDEEDFAASRSPSFGAFVRRLDPGPVVIDRDPQALDTGQHREALDPIRR